MSPRPSESPGGPDRLDPFGALGLPARFDLDPADIRAAYRARAAAMHPDRAADPAARADLARASAQLAEAQRILLDPVRRGEAMLAGLGAAVSAGPPAGEFLVEMMELRESIAEASGDSAKLAAIRADLDDRMAVARDRFSSIMSELAPPGEAGRAGGLRIAADTLGSLRYLDRLRRATEEPDSDAAW